MTDRRFHLMMKDQSLFDGEKIIVNVPVGHEALEHIGSEEDLPFPVVYTHQSHHQDQQPSPQVQSQGGNPVFNKEKAREHVERARQARESARNKESKPGKADVPDDTPADREPDIVLPDFLPDANGEEPAAEDEEQTIRDRVNNHLRIMGLHDAFGHGDWYTARLDPFVSHAATQITEEYFERLRESTAGSLATAVIEESQLSGQEQVSATVSEPESKSLNYHFSEHASKHIDGWSETGATEAEFSEVLLTHWADTYGVEVPQAIVESSLEIQLAEFLLFIHYHRESYYSKTGQYSSPYSWSILEKDYADFLPLLALLNPPPLDDLEALLQALGIEHEADAISVLRPKVELVYSRVGKELPSDWAYLADPVRFANMLYDSLGILKTRLNSDWEFTIDFSLDQEFNDEYLRHGYRTIHEDSDILAGVDRNADLGLLKLILSLWEPTDWVLTSADIREHLENEEWFLAGVNFALLVAPGMSGYTDDLLKLPDDVADLLRRLKVDIRIPGVPVTVQRSELLNRGLSEQVIEDMISGAATRPAWGQGAGKTEGILEYVDPRATRTKQQSIENQNEVAKFLGSEAGYHVVSLGPETNNAFRNNVEAAIGYRGTGDPDIVILHRADDGSLVGREFDIYSPVSDKINTLFNEIRDKVREQGTRVYKQADRIVLNLEHVVDQVSLERLKDKLEDWSKGRLKEIIVVGKIGESYYQKDVWIFKG